MPLTCPYCDRPAELVGGNVIYPHMNSLHHLKFWLCRDCNAYVGCHRKGKRAHGIKSDGSLPLGTLANAKLRKARNAAHRAFDPIWRRGDMKRTDAYAWLAERMGISAANCHIARFDEEQCARVVELCAEFEGETA